MDSIVQIGAPGTQGKNEETKKEMTRRPSKDGFILHQDGKTQFRKLKIGVLGVPPNKPTEVGYLVDTAWISKCDACVLVK